MQDFIPVTPEETQARFDVGAKAAELSAARERKHQQQLLAEMPADVLVETLRLTADKVPQPVVEDVLRAAANRLERYARAFA